MKWGQRRQGIHIEIWCDLSLGNSLKSSEFVRGYLREIFIMGGQWKWFIG
jgi:hypothetical protein